MAVVASASITNVCVCVCVHLRRVAGRDVEQGDDESGGESCHRVEQKSDSKFFLVESGPDLSDYEPTTTKLHSGRRRRPGRVKPNRCVAGSLYR